MNHDKGYFDWLCSQVDCESNRSKDYELILNNLFDIPFTYVNDMDANRYIDGEMLQKCFVLLQKNGECRTPSDIPMSHEDHVKYGVHWFCSVLEMMIALTKRISFIMDGYIMDNTIPRWFWEMMSNLKLQTYSDRNMMFMSDVYSFVSVQETISKFIFRKYKKNGEGGLFPLMNPEKDQRKVEIWYQMMDYLKENYIENLDPETQDIFLEKRTKL